MDRPSEVNLMLRRGILHKLRKKYDPFFGESSKLLCAGILNSALLDAPEDEEARLYWEANDALIEQQARALFLNKELAYALSVLYSFTLIQWGPKHLDRSMALVARASELNILLRSTEEICPTEDGMKFLAYVRGYALDLLD